MTFKNFGWALRQSVENQPTRVPFIRLAACGFATTSSPLGSRVINPARVWVTNPKLRFDLVRSVSSRVKVRGQYIRALTGSCRYSATHPWYFPLAGTGRSDLETVVSREIAGAGSAFESYPHISLVHRGKGFAQVTGMSLSVLPGS